jgi:hypothetical protein
VAQFWPYQSTIKNVSTDQNWRMMRWLFDCYGSLSFQGWNYQYDGKTLQVMFITQDQKAEFDLTWSG